MDGSKERQGDFVFTATEMGEYRFCFNNQMSTFAEKFVDFEIAVRPLFLFLHYQTSITSLTLSFAQVENEERASIPAKQGTSPEQTSALEESIFKLSGQLSTVTRNQKYFRTRENRNFSTVRSTERRIFNFSVIESLMMVCMAGLQVFIVRFFFQVCDVPCELVLRGYCILDSADMYEYRARGRVMYKWLAMDMWEELWDWNGHCWSQDLCVLLYLQPED